jgi:hypothetical protein
MIQMLFKQDISNTWQGSFNIPVLKVQLEWTDSGLDPAVGFGVRSFKILGSMTSQLIRKTY